MLFRGDWRDVCSRVACSFSRCKRRDSRLYGESHSNHPQILVKSLFVKYFQSARARILSLLTREQKVRPKVQTGPHLMLNKNDQWTVNK